jgi:hypothetical protein
MLPRLLGVCQALSRHDLFLTETPSRGAVEKDIALVIANGQEVVNGAGALVRRLFLGAGLAVKRLRTRLKGV